MTQRLETIVRMCLQKSVIVGLLCAGSANAAVVIQDDFSGSSAISLNGQAADVGGVWTAHADAAKGWKADGSIISTTTGDDFSAYIAMPEAVTVGRTYTLTATLDSTTAPFGWIGLVDGAPDVSERLQHSNRGVMMDFHGPSSRRWSNTDPVGNQINGTMFSSSASTMTLVVDASTGLNNGDNVSFYIDGVFKESSSFNLAGLDTLGIGSEAAPGTLNLGSVSLTVDSEGETVVISSFAASPESVLAGDTTTLSWSTANADFISIDQGIGDVTGLTSISVVVNTDTTYTLTATNEYGSATEFVHVTAEDLSLPADPPNIVLVMADDVGFGDLSCYGSPSIYTPNLDRLARQGARFTQFTTCGPGDLANQYALLTGRVARRGNLPAALHTGDAGGLDSREWTLGESLRKAGYETAFIGVWHLGDLAGNLAVDQGFQLFYGLPCSGAPTPPLIENDTVVDAEHNPDTLLSQLTGRASTFIAAQDDAPFLLVFQPPSLPASGTSLQGSHGNRVEALDGSVGQLLDALEASNHTNTLVVFCSDEGPDLGSSGYPIGSSGLFRDGNSTTWEGGVRVPAIASWPGVIPAATDNYAVFWLPDLLPSLAYIAGAYTPSDRPYDGASRPAVLLAAQTLPDNDAMLYLHRHDGSGYQLQAVRKGAWKYHLSYQYTDPRDPQPSPPSPSATPLYQLDIDPTEHIDRSSTHFATLSDLQQEAADYEATFTGAQLPPARPAFISPPSLWIEAGGAFRTSFVRPGDSLNDHYCIQYAESLLLPWNELLVDDYVLSVTPRPGEEETVEVSVPFDIPEFSGFLNNFFRISGDRP